MITNAKPETSRDAASPSTDPSMSATASGRVSAVKSSTTRRPNTNTPANARALAISAPNAINNSRRAEPKTNRDARDAVA